MIPWFKQYDIRIRAVMIPGSKVLLIMLMDHKNGCILDMERHRLPPNYKGSNGALERWIRRRVCKFVDECAEIGLAVDEAHWSGASFFKRSLQRARRAINQATANL